MRYLTSEKEVKDFLTTLHCILEDKDFNKKVLCLSFHYAEWEMNFPYA